MKRVILVSLLAGSLAALTLILWHAGKASKVTVASGPKIGSTLRNPTNTAVSQAAATNTLTATRSLALAAITGDSSNAITAFSNWAERQMAGDASATLAQGVALAWKRREVMLDRKSVV